MRIQLTGKNKQSFALSDREYVWLTTSALQHNLDWMPVGDDTYISGEPPDVQLREDEEIDNNQPPGSVSVAGVAKLAQLVTLLLVETSRTTGLSSGNKFISTPRLEALADWLKDAEEVSLQR